MRGTKTNSGRGSVLTVGARCGERGRGDAREYVLGGSQAQSGSLISARGEVQRLEWGQGARATQSPITPGSSECHPQPPSALITTRWPQVLSLVPRLQANSSDAPSIVVTKALFRCSRLSRGWGGVYESPSGRLLWPWQHLAWALAPQGWDKRDPPTPTGSAVS